MMVCMVVSVSLWLRLSDSVVEIVLLIVMSVVVMLMLMRFRFCSVGFIV